MGLILKFSKHISKGAFVKMCFIIAFVCTSFSYGFAQILVSGTEFNPTPGNESRYYIGLADIEQIGFQAGSISSILPFAESADPNTFNAQNNYAIVPSPIRLDSVRYVNFTTPDYSYVYAPITKPGGDPQNIFQYSVTGLVPNSSVSVKLDFCLAINTSYTSCFGKGNVSRVKLAINKPNAWDGDDDNIDLQPGLTQTCKSKTVSGTVDANGNMTFVFKQTEVGSCHALAIKRIEVNGIPNPQIISAQGSEVCAGEQIALQTKLTYNATYQWQVSIAGGAWSNILGATKQTALYEVATTPQDYRFRCVISPLSGGTPINSNEIDVKAIACCTENGVPASRKTIFLDDFGRVDLSDPTGGRYIVWDYSDIQNPVEKTLTTSTPFRWPLTPAPLGATFRGTGPPVDGEYCVAGYITKNQPYNGIVGARMEWAGDVTGPLTGTDPAYDHSGEIDGACLFINCPSGSEGKVIYKRDITNLCNNKQLFFECWITVFTNNANGTYNPVDVTFNLKEIGGPATATANATATRVQDGGTGQWVRVNGNINLTTGSGISMEVINNSPHTGGNDLVIDDIKIMACSPPTIDLYFDLATLSTQTLACTDQLDLVTKATTMLKTYYGNNPLYLYQWSKTPDDYTSWVNIGTPIAGSAGEINSSITNPKSHAAFAGLNDGDKVYFRVVAATDAIFTANTNFQAPNHANINDPCKNYSVSEPIEATLECPQCNKPTSVTIPSSDPSYTIVDGVKTLTVCSGALATLNGIYVDGSGTNKEAYQYTWYKKGTTPTYVNNTTVANKTLTAADAGTWILRVEDGNAGTASCYTEDSIKFVVTAIPAAPDASAPLDFCEGKTLESTDIWKATAATGNSLHWYNAATAGTEVTVGVGGAPVIPTTVGTQEVWVSQKTSAATGGCESPRTPLSVEVVGIPSALTPTAPSDFCENSTAPTWSATAATGHTLQWYTVATGGTVSATAPAIPNTTAGIQEVWVSQKLTAAPGCESPRAKMSVEVIAAPAVPTTTASSDFCLDSLAPTWSATAIAGSDLLWYTAAAGGTGASVVPTIPNTPVGIKEIWVSQKLTAAPGCESTRTKLSVEVTPATDISSVVPNKTTLCEEEALTITATATGTDPLSYVWKRDGAVVGTNSNILSIASVSSTDAGSYTVEVTGPCGVKTSTAVVITINTKPAITTQPLAASGCVGSNNSLVVVATGTPTPTYQWKKAGTTLAGETSSTLSFSPLTTTSGGSYTVDVTNSCGTVTSTATLVTITTTEIPGVTLTTDISQGCGDGATVVTLTASGSGGGSAPEYTFTVDGVLIGTANQLSNTTTYTLPANTTYLTQNLNFSVEMLSNTQCLDASALGDYTAKDDTPFKSDAQNPVANIIESDQDICVDNITLTTDALPVGFAGTDSWTTTQGSVAGGVVTGLTTSGIIDVTYTIDSELKLCPATSDVIKITKVGSITDPAPVNAQDKTICESASAPLLTGLTLKTGETATWSPAAGTTATISATGQTAGLSLGINEFEYTISNGVCPDQTGVVTITVDAEPVQPTVANASITTCANSVQMAVSAVSPSTAVGVWSGFVSPQNMDDINDPATFLNGLTSGATANLTWSVTNGACTTPKTVTVTVNKLADLSANDILIAGESLKGKTKEICLSAGTVTLNALPFDAATETGNWVLISGSNTNFNPLGSNPQTITLNSVGQTKIGYEIGKQAGGCPTDLVEFTLDVQNITLSAGTLTASNTCEDTQVTTPFTASPTGAGSAPTYKWYLNNVLQPATGSSYTPASNTAAGTYTVKVEVTSSELCATPAMDAATTTFTVHANPVVSIVGSGIYCPGSSTDLVASPGGLTNYVWTKELSTTPAGNGSILTISSPDTYHVTATDANGCIGTDKKVGKEAVISATIETNIGTTQCLGESIILSTSEIADHYLWTRNGSVVGSGPEYAATKSGVYKVTLTFGTIPGSSCDASDQEVLIFVDQPAPVIAQSDTVVCETTPYQLTASDLNGLPGTYTWYKTGIVNPIGSGTSFTVTETGNYYVELDNNYCENQSSSVYVEVDRVPRVKIEPKVQYILEGSSAVLSAVNSTGGHYYAWTSSVSTVIDSPSDPTILVHPDSSHTKYYVTVQSLHKVCEAKDSADVYVELAVRPWNSFSPNGDGVYDSWIIESMDTYPNAVVEVYNRWGNLVWQSKGYTKPWQGENFRNGLPLPVATYYYIIYPNGGTVKKPLTGHVTIVR